MTMPINETHNPEISSWVPGASQHAEFPIQNLPLGRILRGGAEHVVTAIGDYMLDLSTLAKESSLPAQAAQALLPVAEGALTPLMAAGPAASAALRDVLFNLLREGTQRTLQELVSQHLLARAQHTLLLPCHPPTFADFYSSIHHARRIGALVRPDAPLMANYTYMPVGYHGRTSTIFASGHVFPRPKGQIVAADKEIIYAACRKLDYEAELGFIVGAPSTFGEPIAIDQAREHLFGVTVLNDWSARDIQFWEYAPLGPFLGKSFASTLGGWIVTREALAPFWVAPPWDTDRQLLPHLDAPQERESGGLNITVEVYLQSHTMRANGIPRHRISTSNAADSFWTMGQMLTHCSSNGATLSTGDLIGSGTLSGPSDDSRACLMELTSGGREPFMLPSGESRTFVEDEDEITLAAWCSTPGRARISLGETTARVVPAHA